MKENGVNEQNETFEQAYGREWREEKSLTPKQQEVFIRLIPAYCPNCGELFNRTDVKGITGYGWSTLCGYCGAVYSRIEPEL